jgi:FkbM family methyltransferase
MFVSYAQNFEDVMLWRALRDVEHGFYVDLGAQDPLVDSVSPRVPRTRMARVHVEPSSFYAEALRQHRPGDIVIQAAVGDGAPLVTFFEIPNSGISTVDPAIAEGHRQRGFVVRELQIPSIPLSAVFDACPSEVIHWLKIDIEGSERSALASWGSSTRRPWGRSGRKHTSAFSDRGTTRLGSSAARARLQVRLLRRPQPVLRR